jgi:hypothetical protein
MALRAAFAATALVVLALTALAPRTGIAQSATDAQRCSQLQSGTGTFTNGCNQKITIHYCIGNPKSAFNCRQLGSYVAGGSVDLSPGKSHFIPYYRTDGGGSVQWVTCFHPQFPRDWSLATRSYHCQ